MYCKYCGRSITIDSTFCPYCGKLLGQPQARSNQNIFTSDRGISQTFKKSVFVLSIITLIVFLVLLWKMVPNIVSGKTLSYIIVAAIAFVLFYIFSHFYDNSESKFFFYFAAIVAALILVSSVGLRIVYEAKVDAYIADVPTDGKVVLKIKTTTNYYSYLNSGVIQNPRTSVYIDGKDLKSGSTFTAYLNKTYPMTIHSGYRETYGNKKTDITFSKNSISGKSLEERIVLNTNEYAIVNLSFSREGEFWDVIRYQQD